MCSAEGSTHVPFQKKFVVYIFYKSLMLKSVGRNRGRGGYRIQSYFPSTVPGNEIASSHLLTLYSSTPSLSQRYSYKPSSEPTQWVDFDHRNFQVPTKKGKGISLYFISQQE